LLIILINIVGYSQSEKGLRNIQKWLKGFGESYSINKLRELDQIILDSQKVKYLPKEIVNLNHLKELWIKKVSFQKKEIEQFKKRFPTVKSFINSL